MQSTGGAWSVPTAARNEPPVASFRHAARPPPSAALALQHSNQRVTKHDRDLVAAAVRAFVGAPPVDGRLWRRMPIRAPLTIGGAHDLRNQADAEGRTGVGLTPFRDPATVERRRRD